MQCFWEYFSHAAIVLLCLDHDVKKEDGVSHHFVIALEWHIRSGNDITKKRQSTFPIRHLTHWQLHTTANSDTHTSKLSERTSGKSINQDKSLRAENSCTGFWNIELRAEIVPD
jgi:hypothetical protein